MKFCYSWNLCFSLPPPPPLETPAWHLFVIHTVFTVPVLDSCWRSERPVCHFKHSVSGAAYDSTVTSSWTGIKWVWARTWSAERRSFLPSSFSVFSLPQTYSCQVCINNISVRFIIKIEDICICYLSHTLNNSVFTHNLFEVDLSFLL